MNNKTAWAPLSAWNKHVSLSNNLLRKVTTCATACSYTVALTAGFYLSALAASAADNSGMKLQGVNISGGEFTPSAVPGVIGTNYIYPSTSDLDYFKSKGMNCIRVPFCWERMQTTPGGALSQNELRLLDQVVVNCTTRGLSVILDPHNYGAYQNKTVGVPGGHANSVFASLWSQLAAHYINYPSVV